MDIIKMTPQEALEYLQTYYECFLIDFQADVVEKIVAGDAFYIGAPNYIDNGTDSFHVSPKDGFILVETRRYTEKMNETKILSSKEYESIDEWMKFHRYSKSEKKSKPRNNYRTNYHGVRV